MYAPAGSHKTTTTTTITKVFDELACAIKDINVDYMLVCGDFNCVLKSDLDISGEKHVERVVLKFNDLLSDCDLHNTWRLFTQKAKNIHGVKKIHLLLED